MRANNNANNNMNRGLHGRDCGPAPNDLQVHVRLMHLEAAHSLTFLQRLKKTPCYMRGVGDPLMHL